MYTVCLGLGSNLGNRLSFLQQAADEIQKMTTVIALSPVYEAEPVGMESSHLFYNVALKVETTLEPHDLLREIKNIEKNLGRSPHTHMKDREIDIDILLYNGLYYEDHVLYVPHPHLSERRFVLTMLNDVASTMVEPISGESVSELLSKCTDQSSVQRTTNRIQLSH